MPVDRLDCGHDLMRAGPLRLVVDMGLIQIVLPKAAEAGQKAKRVPIAKVWDIAS